MKFSNGNKVLLFLCVLALGSFLWWKYHRPSVDVSASVKTGQAVRKDLIERITISGKISARKRLDVKPSFTGFVQKIFVKIGDSVKAGDPLVTFSPSLNGSETNYPVRAAFAGKVTTVLKTEGEYVMETGDQNMVLRVDDLSEMFVIAYVPELDIAKVKVGQKANIKITSLVGETFPGKIKEIALSAREKDRWASSSAEFQVTIAVDSHDPRILPGMTVLCDVVTNRAEKALVLGHEYIQQDENENPFATLIDGTKRNLKLGLQTDEGVQIKEGLAEGEKVQVVDFLSLPQVPD